MIILPVAVEPVKATFSIFGCLAMAAPAVAPKPETMLITPFGIPASTNNWERYKADNGVDSAVFKTVVEPVARTGPNFQEAINNGKFQGII